MLFSKRLLLSEQYEEWKKDNKVKDSALSVITYLDIIGCLKQCALTNQNIKKNNKKDRK